MRRMIGRKWVTWRNVLLFILFSNRAGLLMIRCLFRTVVLFNRLVVPKLVFRRPAMSSYWVCLLFR